MKLSITCNRSSALLSLVMLLVLTYAYYLTFNKLHSSTTSTKKSSGEVVRIASLPTQSKPEVPYVKPSDSSNPEVIQKQSDFLLNSELKEATVITRSETTWSRDEASCEGDKSFVKTVLHSPAGDTPIYVHPSAADTWVSGSVIKGGVWEKETVTKFYNILKGHPDLQFIDIGANIGIYGLTIAKLGRKVLMVEPMLKNVQKICRSLRDGQFKDAYVLHNALSSKRFTVGFGTYKGNIGGTYVRNVTSEKEETAYAILLDDLLGLFKFTAVAIKLDVETHEGQVLAGGSNFFTSVDVRYLMLEWHADKKTTGQGILDFLTLQKMKPYHPIHDNLLDLKDFKNWPGDVLWKKM